MKKWQYFKLNMINMENTHTHPIMFLFEYYNLYKRELITQLHIGV